MAAGNDEPPIMQWHQIVAPLLKEELDEFSFDVLPELDVTHQQIVDASIDLIQGERKPSAKALKKAPDGFQNLNRFNPCSIKFDEPFDADALEELIGYSVLFRKIRAKQDPGGKPIWKASRKEVSLYAVCRHKPSTPGIRGHLKAQLPGIYGLALPGRVVTVIVPWQTRKIPRNAIWHLISGKPKQVEYGIRHFDWNEHTNANIMHRLIKHYHLKGIAMAATVEDYIKRWKLEDAEETLLEHPEILEKHPQILEKHPQILEKHPQILTNNPSTMLSALGSMSEEEITEFLSQAAALKKKGKKV